MGVLDWEGWGAVGAPALLMTPGPNILQWLCARSLLGVAGGADSPEAETEAVTAAPLGAEGSPKAGPR